MLRQYDHDKLGRESRMTRKYHDDDPRRSARHEATHEVTECR